MTVTLPGPGVTVNSDGSWTLPCLLRFLNPLDIVNTGVGTLTVLPADGSTVNDGIAQFVPLLGQGPQGFTPNFNATVLLNELAPGASPPSGTPTASWAMTDAGDETTPPTWQLTLYLHRGDDGTFTMPNVEDLADVEGTVGDGLTITYVAADGKWKIGPPHITQVAACTSFTAASGTTPNQTLGSLVLSEVPYGRFPLPRAQCVVNPASDGSTTIKLLARLGGTDSGSPIIGQSPAWTASAPYVASLEWNAAALSNPIGAGAAGTIYLIAQQTTSSTQPWSTTMTDATFTAEGIPVS